MIKIVLSAALIAVGFTCSYATSIEDLTKDALINKTDYELLGTFGEYDFKGADSAFNWAFTMSSSGKSYQLKGNEPSDDNAFGWKSANITKPTPLWYMFPVDIDGDGKNGKFEWVMLSADINKKSAYKLAGANDNGTFAYSGKIDIDYKIDGTSITTGAAGTFQESKASEIVEEQITDQSLVIIYNSITKSVCDGQNAAESDYEGYVNYEAFVEAGGVSTTNFYANISKSCSEYSISPECIVNDFTTEIGGDSSCVRVITFPEGHKATVDEEIEDTEDSATPVVDGLGISDVDEFMDALNSNIWDMGYGGDDELFFFSVTYTKFTFHAEDQYASTKNLYDSMDSVDVMPSMYNIKETPYTTKGFGYSEAVVSQGTKCSKPISYEALEYLFEKKTKTHLDFTQGDTAQMCLENKTLTNDSVVWSLALDVFYNESASLKIKEYLEDKYDSHQVDFDNQVTKK
ncbi:MAG: hypothetical protein U9P71_03100 [Campylobacterota bacterium]|nr:hypothetical protein [Campylobacterota bacterium]